jgi:YggT family protein
MLALIDFAFEIYTWILIARVISSWVQPPRNNQTMRKILRFVYEATEPVLAPIRRMLPTGGLGIDFSPIVAFIAINIIRSSLLNILTRLLYY